MTKALKSEADTFLARHFLETGNRSWTTFFGVNVVSSGRERNPDICR